MNSKSLFLPWSILALSGLIAMRSLLAHAADYSFSDDFKNSPKQANTATNTWQYFYNVDVNNRLGSNYTRFPGFSANHVSQGFEAWHRTGLTANSNNYPFIGKNTSSHIVFGVSPNEGMLVPDSPNGVAIGFRSPADGSYDISGAVRLAFFSNDNGARWWLDKGSGKFELAAGIVAPGETNNFFLQSVQLRAGEFLYLVCEGNSDIHNDWVAVALQISQSTSALSLTFVPALQFGGTLGRTYRVEFLNAFGDASGWKTLTTITSTGAGQLILDPSLTTLPRRFYRTVEVP